MLLFLHIIDLVVVVLSLIFFFLFRFAQNKLQNLAGQHSDVLENLSPAVKKRVEVLRDIQVDYGLFSFWFEIVCSGYILVESDSFFSFCTAEPT